MNTITILALTTLLPLFINNNNMALQNMILTTSYMIIALGLNIIISFTKLLDLDYMAFYTIGTHITTHLTSPF